jgi:hypothetical protein
VSLLIRDAAVVTVDGARRLLDPGAVVVARHGGIMAR